MFIVKLHYTKPLSEIDRLMNDHVRFLEDCFRAGVFIAAGRQVPRIGGVILAVGPGKEDLEEILQHDPFIVAHAANYEIVEFRTSLHHPVLAPFADPSTRAVQDAP